MNGVRLEAKVHFRRGRRSKKELQTDEERDAVLRGRIPRVSHLMALAIRFEQLVRDGIVADYAELAELGHVTRARMTQITNLLHLSPEIQEAILFLPPVSRGKDPLTERKLRTIVAEADWRTQRQLWADNIA